MDIDIDINNNQRDTTINLFGDIITIASNIVNNKLIPHQVGIYFQQIPKDKITGLSAIPYEESEQYGYFKIDLISLKLLSRFKTKAELNAAIKKVPDWKMLEDEIVVSKLFQISKHFDVVKKIKPQSILELADVLALIRPEKRKLLNDYIKDRERIRNTVLYKKESGSKSSFKKCHAIPYAMLIIADMNTINIVKE